MTTEKQETDLRQTDSRIESVMRQNTHSPSTDRSSLDIPSIRVPPILDPCSNNSHQLPLSLESLPSPRNNRHLCIRVDTHCPARLLADGEEFGKDW